MKKILLFLSLVGIIYIPTHKTINVKANSTQLSSMVSTSSTSTSSFSTSTSFHSEQVEEETTIIDKLEKEVIEIWNTQVMPIIAGISLASIVNFIYSWVINRKNKKTTEECSKTVENITALMNKTIELSKGVANDLKDSKEIIDNLSVNFNNMVHEFMAISNKIIYETKNIRDIRPLLVAMSEIITKFALSSKEIVRNGVGEEIAELQNYVRGVIDEK